VRPTNGGSLTIGPGITVRNATNSKFTTLGDPTLPLIIQGTVLAQSSGQTLRVTGSYVMPIGWSQAAAVSMSRMSLVRTLLSEEPNSRFTLFYGNRDSSSVIFLEALAGLKDKYLGRLEIYHFLDAEEQDIELFNGMLSRERLEEAIPALVPDAAEVEGWFICGPGPMMDAAEGVLLDRSIPKDRIHVERFTADRPPEAVAKEMAQLQTQAEGVTVAVTLDGRTRRVPFTQGNILDSARASGLPAPFACKAGVCATCRAKVTKGKVEMAARYGLTDEEVADGYVLTCQSVPLGDGVAVDYDA